MSRYKNTTKILNDVDYYEFLTKKRGVSKIVQYETPIIYNPNVADRISLKSTPHIWKYGDRLYNIASKYYGDSSYWWVIAWYNGVPTEAHIKTGTTIEIPINIERALKALGL